VKKLSDLGERKAIKIIESIISQGEIPVGIGDDCAALELNDDYLLVTTDMIAEKTHISNSMKPWQIGWYIVAINLSDIAAKGGKPLGLVLSLGLPSKTSESFLKDLIKGADDCASFYNTFIVGGDTKENSEITLCGTAFGVVEKSCFMSRMGAKHGDVVAVTGSLGKAAAGYLSLENDMDDEHILKNLFEPKPRIFEGVALSKEKIVSSCMDISDGLSSSLYQIKNLNKIGFKIYKGKIPLSQNLKEISEKIKDINVDDYFLHFGGDYELLITLSKQNFINAQICLETIGCNLTEIGRVTKDSSITIIEGDVKEVLPNKGYEHFKNNNVL